MKAIYVGIGAMLWVWLFFNLHRRQRNRNKVVYVAGGDCTGCRRCVKRCRRHVLEMVEDASGKRAVVKHPERCTACGDCLGKCRALRLIERI